jgi:hypothetical protein
VLALQRGRKKEPMKKPTRRNVQEKEEKMRPEYDFSAGIRGKYVDRFRSGTNVILLEPDVAEALPDSKSVNGALRELLAIARRAKTPKSA